MNVWPLRFRELDVERIFFANDAGGFFVSAEPFLARYASGALTDRDHEFLRDEGHAFGAEGDLSHTAFAYRWVTRQTTTQPLAYVILVPTLRCNLACTYCQVSRASESARGYDWTGELLGDVLRFLDGLQTQAVKIEFQGGEPLLRPDLLENVRAFCRARFASSQFVVCTNLQTLGPDQLAFLDDADTFISTSVDGAPEDHDRHRTQDPALAEAFFTNLRTVIERFGAARLSALPTIDLDSPPDIASLVATYEGLGLHSIYLRPVNYHGFARRTPLAANDIERWNEFHGRFLDTLIARNFATGRVMEEYYFSLCLRRMLRPGQDGHMDLRNPGLFGSDYVVIDYDGRLYPTDEARMLARIGHIDLSIGTASSGLDHAKIANLNHAALNNFDPDCIHCAYQPFCGSDPIDDVSRYGRIDVPRPTTWFCGRQLAIFDRVARLLYSRDEKELFSLRHWAGVVSWPPQLAPVHT